MAKKTFKLAIKGITNNLNKIYSRNFLSVLASHAQRIVYNRVKAGYGVSSLVSKSATKERLEPLSESYIEYRRKQKLGQFGAPGKSNLTLTGEMLENLKFEATSTGFRLYFPKKRHSKAGIAISLLSQYVQEQRPFLNLTIDERRILVREVEVELRKLARRKI